jgi:hypothetical protein
MKMKRGHRRLIARLAVVALAVALIGPGAQASLVGGATIYVDAGAAGAADGTSWADAYADLEDALDAAKAGDQIWVAQGIYKPTVPHGCSGNICKSFQMKNGVAIYGGFDPDAGATGFEERDWEGNPTILSGDIGIEGEGWDNILHVFYHPYGTDLDSSAVLDGFTITGGKAIYGKVYPEAEGGGMYNEGSSPTLIHCTFSGNAASLGGGMYNEESSPTLIDCTFSGNSGLYFAGGMLNVGSSSPTLTNCTFEGNSAFLDGGGMENLGSSSPTLTNCILWGNVPGQILSDSRSPVVTYSDVQGGYTGEGNIDADPLFLDAANGDYHLRPGSPCIDAGYNAAPNLPAHDFEGDPRIVDGDGDGVAVVDMGVDEVFWHFVYLPLVPWGY